MSLKKKVTLVLRLPEDLKDALKLRCCKEKVSMTKIIEKLLREYLDKHDAKLHQ